jgi:hypothetical protein
MSRFLGSYKGLKRRLARLEKERIGWGLGPAMAEHARTGNLPSDHRVRAQLMWFLDAVEAMKRTMPGPGPSEDSR